MDSGLTFDWDGVSIEEDLVNIELTELFDHFGEGKVWYRVSSSGKGLHIMIADMYYDPPTNKILLRPYSLIESLMLVKMHFASHNLRRVLMIDSNLSNIHSRFLMKFSPRFCISLGIPDFSHSIPFYSKPIYHLCRNHSIGLVEE